MFFDSRWAILADSYRPVTFGRRKFLAAVSFAGALSLTDGLDATVYAQDKPSIGPAPPPTGPASLGQGGAKLKLQVANTKDRNRHVKILLEARGELKLNNGSAKSTDDKIRRIPMEVKGELEFTERSLAENGGHCVRRYEKAEARIRIGEGGVKPDLRADRRLIVAKDGPRILYRSPQGPITRGELDLLRTQGDPLSLGGLLPKNAVGVGDVWAAQPGAWAKVMALDSVTKSDIQFRLTKREGDIAMVEFSGVIDGAIGGVATEIQIRGKVNVDSKLQEITWFAISAKEKRAISPAEPGVEATSRLRVAIRSATADSKLTAQAVAGLPLDVESGSVILEMESAKIGFSLIHDPQWRLMIEKPQVAIFRRVDEGEVLAQCNISRLTPRPIDRPFSLMEFQQDIQLALEKQFGQFVDTQQYDSDNGQTVLRVTASGLAQEVPIHWIYYHITDARGERLTLAFTLDAKMVERFGGADRTLVNSLVIKPPPQPRAASGSGSSSP